MTKLPPIIIYNAVYRAAPTTPIYLNKPAAQAAGADPSRCNSTNRQNPPLQ